MVHDVDYNATVTNPMKKTWRRNLKTPKCSVCNKVHAYEAWLEICMECLEYVCPEHKYRHPDCGEGR